MEVRTKSYDGLLHSGARRLTGCQRRSFMAEVAKELCVANSRQAEVRFGWGRETVEKGLHEARSGIRCLEDFSARSRRRSEDKNPQLAAGIRAIVEPHTQANPEPKSSRRYVNLSAEEVRDALTAKGHDAKKLPGIRTLRDVLNRMNYRLKRIRKRQAAEENQGTDAIFANLQTVREEACGDPETLEIPMDTQAKVQTGDDALGGENPDERSG